MKMLNIVLLSLQSMDPREDFANLLRQSAERLTCGIAKEPTMASLEIDSFLQNLRQQVAPDVQNFVGNIPQEVQTAIESGLRDVLTLARPLFGPDEATFIS